MNRSLKNSHLAAVLANSLVRRSAVYARGYYASAGLSAGGDDLTVFEQPELMGLMQEHKE